jgi:hypothetical protein
VPGAVSNLRVTEQGSQHAKVEWDPPAEPNGDITGYTVQYKPEDGDEWQSVDIKDPSQEFVKIKNLDPNTAYDIKVLANTKPGAGEEQTAKVQTKPDGGMQLCDIFNFLSTIFNTITTDAYNEVVVMIVCVCACVFEQRPTSLLLVISEWAIHL